MEGDQSWPFLCAAIPADTNQGTVVAYMQGTMTMSKTAGPRQTESSVRPRPPQSPTQALANKRVLVVDDDPDARRLVSLILAQAGAIVEEAGSADVAFASLRDFRPQLLVSDIEMPVEDGYCLMRRIRAVAAEGGGNVPAIALTGTSGGAARREALSAGFTEHLTKPVSPLLLIETASALSAASSG
jgi:CheY-like chemotaxis protein